MTLEFQELPYTPREVQLTHVRDLMDTNRAETNQRLKRIVERLGSEALQSIELGHGLDNYDLVA